MEKNSEAIWVPLHFSLKDKPCLFVGGGAVNERRILSILPSKAMIILVAPEITPKLAELAHQGEIEWRRRPFLPEDAKGTFLAFVAVNGDPTPIVEVLKNKGVLVNLASAGREGDFLVPYVIREGDVVVSVSTSGSDPAFTKRLGRWLREKICSFLREETG